MRSHDQQIGADFIGVSGNFQGGRPMTKGGMQLDPLQQRGRDPSVESRLGELLELSAGRDRIAFIHGQIDDGIFNHVQQVQPGVKLLRQLAGIFSGPSARRAEIDRHENVPQGQHG